MSEILINDTIIVEGELSFKKTVDNSQKPPKLIIEGLLSTHKYFEEITQVESERYVLKGINVQQESYGSNDFNIVYGFYAVSAEAKGGQSIYTEKEIQEIEQSIIQEKEGENQCQQKTEILQEKKSQI